MMINQYWLIFWVDFYFFFLSFPLFSMVFIEIVSTDWGTCFLSLNLSINQLGRHLLCKVKTSLNILYSRWMFMEFSGGSGRKASNLVILSFLKEKGCDRKCQSHTMLGENVLNEKKSVLLWALENTNTGLILYIKLLKIAN